MSMCVLGMSGEFKQYGIGVNALWPRTGDLRMCTFFFLNEMKWKKKGIATAAIEFISGSDGIQNCRTVDIMSDAAYQIFKLDGKKFTGNFFLDDEVLLSFTKMTEKDLEKYTINPSMTQSPPSPPSLTKNISIFNDHFLILLQNCHWWSTFS